MFCCRSKKKKAKKKAAAQAQELVAQAGAVASQAAEKIRPVAAHLATQAQELAHQGKEWVAPKAAQAAQLAAEAKEKAVTDYIPKAKRVARAAVDAARTTEGDLKTKAQAVQASAAAALADPKPKKKRRFLKVTGTLAILGGAAGAEASPSRTLGPSRIGRTSRFPPKIPTNPNPASTRPEAGAQGLAGSPAPMHKPKAASRRTDEPFPRGLRGPRIENSRNDDERRRSIPTV